MNVISAFNRTLRYIEQNLEKTIDKKTVALLSGYSYAQFSRLFSILAGYPLSEYIRLRKLSLAARELSETNKRVLDVALGYGYESVNAFTVAFKTYHGVLPKEVRAGRAYRLFPPVHFSLAIQGGKEMDIRIENKDEFHVIGLSFEQIQKGADFGQFWQKFSEILPSEKWTAFGSGQPYGICYDVNDGEVFNYMTAIDNQNLVLAESFSGLQTMTIPEAKYAVLTLLGALPESIHEGWKYLMGSFFPEQGLQHAGSPDFEVYGEGDIKADDYQMELWVPIISKKQ